MNVVVVGLGRMGAPVAGRLALVHDVIGCDPDPAAASRVPEIRAGALTEVVAAADALVTVLPGPSELRDALEGGDLLERTRPGALWVDLTSCDPETGAELHARAAAHGVESVTAPMLGGPSEAQRGQLGFLLGGAESAHAAATVLLNELGDPTCVQVIGAVPGHAYLMKLLGNLLWFGQVTAVTEALLLAQRSGIAPARAAELLAAGPGASSFLTNDSPALLRGDLMESFGIDRVVEELDHLRRLADASSSPFTVSGEVVAIHEAALARFGPQPSELLASALLQEQAGATLASREAAL